ncbi:MAG: ethanolamine ammonia-lyase subunit EutB [Pirellulales bacterium]
MTQLPALDNIPVPAAKSDQVYSREFFVEAVSFQGLKRLLAAADFSKAGDRNAGLAAPTEKIREAARTLLSELTLRHLYENPLTDDAGKVDSVMRVNYAIDLVQFETIADWTLGQFKDWLLNCRPDEAQQIGKALTGVMAAAVAKLCDVHELILIARKIKHTTQARTMLGLPGTLSSRLQPNHPTDDPRGIALLVYWGLSLGAGDALIGLNPAIDTVENVSALLAHLDQIRRQTGAPTQICVLSHIKTQLACLERGAPVEVIFQSLAGTESTLTSEFDVSVDLLDRAYRTMGAEGPLKDVARQFMYFETGQGSEFTYGKHNGIDMTTAEALCYGLARRYDPYMVNNVTGFIGPETHADNFEMIVANLQDHFMGKLLGLPMGMAPCYTLHSGITLDGQQIATQLLTAAGANYYMDVCLNTDRMLAYFDTSGHDNQTLREVHGLKPAPEFLNWAVERGIFCRDGDGNVHRGPQWGNARQFCSSEFDFELLLKATPAAYGFDTAGPRPANRVSGEMRLHQAIGREAIESELDLAMCDTVARFRVIRTEAPDKRSHLDSPSAGARVTRECAQHLKQENCQVQILVSDGLSAAAIHHNLADVLPTVLDGLAGSGISVGEPLLAQYGRVKLAEHVAELLGADLVIHLIGERPGGDAFASRSMSAYLVYRLGEESIQKAAAQFSGNRDIGFEYTVISNIYSRGLPPLEAGAVIVEKAVAILAAKAAGNRLSMLQSSV